MYSEGEALAFDFKGEHAAACGGRSPPCKCSDTELEKILKICYNRHKKKPYGQMHGFFTSYSYI